MDEMKKINVCLYGGKSIFKGAKETALEADEIYCDKVDICTFYKNGNCLRCRAAFSRGCKFGKTVNRIGYTSRAAKYYTFKKQYDSDPLYNKLSHPNALVGRIGDVLYLNPKYVDVSKNDGTSRSDWRGYLVDGYVVEDPHFSGVETFIPIAEITTELLHAILRWRPHSFFAGEIVAYQKEVVPDLIHGLRKYTPELYGRLIEEHPEYDIAPNYVGKKAIIASLKPGSSFKDHNGNTWIYDGEYVESASEIGLSFGSPWWADGGGRGIAKIRVNDKMKFTVTDNSQVDENTRFE